MLDTDIIPSIVEGLASGAAERFVGLLFDNHAGQQPVTEHPQISDMHATDHACDFIHHIF